MKHRIFTSVFLLSLAALLTTYGQPLPTRLVPKYLSNDVFEITVLNGTTANYTIFASTDLLNWIPLTNFISNTPQFQYRDRQAGILEQRFYRVKAEAVPPPLIKPTITTQPQSQTAIEGAIVSFNVVSSGTTPLNYQWMFNEVNINGANNDQITINNVQTSNAGNYTVIISNDAGFAVSQPATLTVNKVSLAPDSIKGKRITCSITSGSPPFAPSGSYKVDFSSISNIYLIFPISGNVIPTSGTYSYTKTSATTATISASDSGIGSIVTELIFINTTGGTFVNRALGASQSGNFSID